MLSAATGVTEVPFDAVRAEDLVIRRVSELFRALVRLPNDCRLRL
jgi:hypothetical protein